MPLGTPLVPETISNAAGNGQHQELTVAQLTAKYGAGNIKTPTAHFAIRVNGHTFVGRKNIPFVTNPELTAALTAAGAPVV